MFDWDLPRYTSSVHVMVQLARDRGMSAGECLDGTALVPEALVNLSAELTARQELRVVRNVLARFGTEPGLAVEAGRRYHVSLYGPGGLALISSRTLRDAVDVALRHIDLAFVFGEMSFVVTDGMARLIFDDTDIPNDVRPFLVERIVTGIHTIGRDMFSAGLRIQHIQFRHDAPADTTAHRELFGVDPVYGAASNELVFDSAFLDVVLPQANDWARETFEQHCRDLLNQRRARAGIAGSVRDLLVRRPGEIPDLNTVAAALFLSPRTLCRRLQEEGTSFRILLDEVRQVLAEELLVHAEMSTEQVASRLGYSEPASFIRAFRRWKGMPPQAFRDHTTSRAALVASS